MPGEGNTRRVGRATSERPEVPPVAISSLSPSPSGWCTGMESCPDAIDSIGKPPATRDHPALISKKAGGGPVVANRCWVSEIFCAPPRGRAQTFRVNYPLSSRHGLPTRAPGAPESPPMSRPTLRCPGPLSRRELLKIGLASPSLWAVAHAVPARPAEKDRLDEARALHRRIPVFLGYCVFHPEQFRPSGGKQSDLEKFAAAGVRTFVASVGFGYG